MFEVVSPQVLEGLHDELGALRSVLGRLWWHTRDAYAQALLAAAAQTLAGHQAGLYLEPDALGMSPKPRPANPAEFPDFVVQESVPALLEACRAAGARLAALYDLALAEALLPSLRERLAEQRAEVADLSAIVSSLEGLVSPRVPLVHALLDDWLHASALNRPDPSGFLAA